MFACVGRDAKLPLSRIPYQLQDAYGLGKQCYLYMAIRSVNLTDR